MAPRGIAPRERDYDFANLGKAGRRTGVTVEHRPLDDHGFEQVSAFFSSPRKPSPLKQMSVWQSDETQPRATPKTTAALRKSTRAGSAPPPRSASPRKSGITGTAKRGNVVDVLGLNSKTTQNQEHVSNQENRPPNTPDHTTNPDSHTARAATMPRRFSPEITPLRQRLASKPRTVQVDRQSMSFVEPSLSNGLQSKSDQGRESIRETVEQNDDEGPIIGDSDDENPTDRILPPQQTLEVAQEDEEASQIFEPEIQSRSRVKEPTMANSRKKRKADLLEDDVEVDIVSSPAAKRAKRRSDEGLVDKSVVHEYENRDSIEIQPQPKPRGRPRSKQNTSNVQLSKQQEKELHDIVEKVRARPGQQKSLYILRRETPADDGVTHTRSGRVSVKPLAYWRNERCVYGGSPGGASLADGVRFPLNSIKEIIRTEELETKLPKKKKAKSSKSNAKRSTSRALSSDPSQGEDSGEDTGNDTEPWETEVGTIRGPISVWDPEQQAPIEYEENIDIAYASGAIQTKEVKDSSFRYAKLLNTKFFGTGIVDLPPRAFKRPKNSRRMHMTFFVAKGRVTVEVGPMNGPETRFSIGKGGFWQVPRGNQYSIRNEQEGLARIFFSQACESSPQDWEE